MSQKSVVNYPAILCDFEARVTDISARKKNTSRSLHVHGLLIVFLSYSVLILSGYSITYFIDLMKVPSVNHETHG